MHPSKISFPLQTTEDLQSFASFFGDSSFTGSSNTALHGLLFAGTATSASLFSFTRHSTILDLHPSPTRTFGPSLIRFPAELERPYPPVSPLVSPCWAPSPATIWSDTTRPPPLLHPTSDSTLAHAAPYTCPVQPGVPVHLRLPTDSTPTGGASDRRTMDVRLASTTTTFRPERRHRRRLRGSLGTVWGMELGGCMKSW